MRRIEKTVFISYRRANVAWALAIAQNLTHHGYDVFFDYTGINSGDFEQIILGNVRSRAHFVVLLTPSALDECERQNDWFRREIEAALEAKLNIVPLMLEGFDFAAPAIAKKITGSLVPLQSYNGLRVPADYFEEAMERLRSRWLNVSLNSVLHPPSPPAAIAAKLQQAAVEAAPTVQESELAAREARERALHLRHRDQIEVYAANPSSTRTWVEISLSRIRQNYQAVRGFVDETAEVMAVVKANAYGHGAVEVSRALEQEGVRWLAVANVEEGVLLRLAGITARILVMADFLPAKRAALEEFALTPVIYSLSDLSAVKVPYHLNVDTGMSQLGVRRASAEIVSRVTQAGAQLQGLMSHLSSAVDYDYKSSQTQEQLQRFKEVLAALQAAGISPRYVHASSTIEVAYRHTEAWGNLVRIGHAIYGYVAPVSGLDAAFEVHPALTWKATVLAIKEVEQGALVGYGGMFRAPHPMRIAVLAAGYADGIPHRLSNRGRVIAAGKFAHILGSVAMDLTIIDVTSCPELRAGDAVTLLGSEGPVSIDAQQIARSAGTISYNVLCGIRTRVKRLFVE